MHIIFGDEQATQLAEKYTVLELDTVRFGNNGPVQTAFCVVENIPIADLPQVDQMKRLHSELMVNYRRRNWEFCRQALEHLQGFWGHELDTFYAEISRRIDHYAVSDPGSDWDGILVKPSKT